MDEKMMRVGIEADGKVFKESLKGVEKSAEAAADKLAREFGEKASSGVDRLESRFKTMQNFLVGAVSIAALKSMGQEFLQQDRALTSLAASYNQAGIYSGALMRQSAALGNEMQRVANAADDQVESGMAVMTTIGKLSEDQIPAATRAAVGLSKVLGIELNEAFKLVGKAAAGKTETLGRYGIVVDAPGRSRRSSTRCWPPALTCSISRRKRRRTQRADMNNSASRSAISRRRVARWREATSGFSRSRR